MPGEQGFSLADTSVFFFTFHFIFALQREDEGFELKPKKKIMKRRVFPPD